MNRITSIYNGSVGIAYNENSLTDEMIQYALNFPRGFGYWRWKPFVILKTMKSMKSNDVLLYVDGRANFKSNSIRFLNDFMSSEQFDIVVNRGGRESIEKNWTTKKALDYFNASPTVRNSPQFGAGLIGIRYNKKN